MWNGAGRLATEEEERQISPILAMEPTASLADIGLQEGDVEIVSDDPDPAAAAAETPAPSPTPVTPDTAAPAVSATPAPVVPAGATQTEASDPVVVAEITDDAGYDDAYTDDGVIYNDDGFMPTTTTTNDAPLQVFEQPVDYVQGATTAEFIQLASSETTTDDGGTATAETTTTTTTNNTVVLAGGVLTDHTATNLPEGDEKLLAAIATETVVPPAGERTIDPINCYGLTGEDCCLLIKLTIPDADVNDNAIQCTLTYSESTEKKKYWKDLRGKKVHIHANHLGYVSKIPEVTGEWPKSFDKKGTAEFEAWLLKGGAPPLIMQGTEEPVE